MYKNLYSIFLFDFRLFTIGKSKNPFSFAQQIFTKKETIQTTFPQIPTTKKPFKSPKVHPLWFVDDKNIMYLNQSDSILSDIILRTSQITFKCSYYKKEVQLQFRDQSEYFLQSINLESLDNLKAILSGYVVKSVQDNKLTFEKDRNAAGCQHGEFIKRIQEFFSNYMIIIICQSCSSSKNLSELRQRLGQISSKIGISKDVKNVKEKKVSMNIFYARCFQREIRLKIEQYKHSRHEKVLFPLNQFIRKQVDPKDYKDFVGSLYKLYCGQLKQLCKGNHNQRKNVLVSILKVSPNIVSRQHASKEWTRKEMRAGLIGIQFEISGYESQFLRFYSLVQSFFAGLTYTIRKTSEIIHYHEDISSYLQKHNLKFAMLKEKVVIFQPPQNLDCIIKELGQKTWVLTAKDYLNLPFSLLSQHKKVYLARLRLKGLGFSNIKVENDSLQFTSDQATYEKIKVFSRQFLSQMSSSTKMISFITSAEEVQVIKKIYMKDSNFELIWKDSNAFVSCPFKDIDENYKRLLDVYQTMSKNTLKIYSRQLIKHDLVKNTQKFIRYSFFRSQSYKSATNQFVLNIRQLAQIEEQNTALFFYNKKDDNSVLINILKRNCKEFDQISSYDLKETSTEHEPNLQFIFVLQLTQAKYLSKKEQRISTLLQELITRKKPFRIVISCKVEEIFLCLLRFILKHLQFRKKQIQNKSISLFVPSSSVNPRFYAVIKSQLQKMGYTRISKYRLSQNEMLIARNLSLVKMTCKTKGKNIQCTSLNSYIFQSQIESSHRKQIQLGLFIPKIQCKQYLVNLKTQQIFRINCSKVQTILYHSHLMDKIINVFKKYFPNQNYAALCCNEDDGISFPSSMYVFKSQNPSILRKARIDYQNEKISILEQSATYSTLIQEQRCYLLETDRQVYPQLANLLQKRQYQ